jgi:hypothetical protein
MSLEFVNQKNLNGKIYIALRDKDNSSLQYVECEGVTVQVRLKEVWNNPTALEALF